MCRSRSPGDLKHMHVSGELDHITFRHGTTKSDQDGTNQVAHTVYGNPLDPIICPLLALGVLVCVSESLGDSQHPFTLYHRERKYGKLGETVTWGEVNASEFGTILQTLISDLSQEDRDQLAAKSKVTNIGTHSLRKGAATFASNQDGVPMPSIFLRAGWSMGLQDRYIFNNNSGSAILGRTLSGLPHGEPQFATLPPHFYPSALRTNGKLNDGWWRNKIQGWEQIESNFKTAVKLAAASVVYHMDFLKSKLTRPLDGERVSDDHLLFNTVFVRAIDKDVRDLVSTPNKTMHLIPTS